MTLFEIIRKFQSLALAAPNVRTASDGDVYEGMNNNPKLKYGVFFITQNTHTELEQMDRYGLTLFYIDRLNDTLEDNRLQIQSIGKEILSSVIRDFCDEYECDLPTMIYTPFTEKFKDLCAGVYVQITIDVFKDSCYDDYSEVISVYQTKTVEITENGEYSILPDGDFTALKEVIVNVDVRCSGSCTEEQLMEYYNSGYTDGYNDGLADCGSDYEQGYTDGIAAQKAKLTSIYVNENGQYNKTNGYSAVTVDVPQTGATIHNQDKSIKFTSNTTTAITFDSGYTGLRNVNIIVDVAQTGYTQQDLDNAYQSGYTSGYTDGYSSGYTDGFQSGYTSGYTDGYDSGSTAGYLGGLEDGKAEQKALLTSTSLTENDTYTRENGWSSVTVNVDLITPYNNGYSSGYTDGLNSGYTSGITYQKSLLTSTAFTENGYYTKEDGWSSVTVNIDVDKYYEEGFEDGIQYYQDLNDYLTVEAIEDGTLVFKATSTSITKTIEYKKNDGPWTQITSTTSGETIPMLEGDIIKLRGDNASYGGANAFNSLYTSGLTKVYVYGNIMSLIDSTGFTTNQTLTEPNTFFKFFGFNSGLTTNPTRNIVLPATSLTENCYNELFYVCSSITSAPRLPATTLAQRCYWNMFYGCRSLVNAPVLPALVVPMMAYKGMFINCTSLQYIKCMATDITADRCTEDWVGYIETENGTFIKNKNMNAWTTGKDGIPSGWTVFGR